MLFNTRFLSQRAGSDLEPGGVRCGGWGGWSVGKRNLDSDVFRKALVYTQKEVLKTQPLPPQLNKECVWEVRGQKGAPMW